MLFDYILVSTTEPPSEYKKILLLRCIHHFKSDLINNMDHMRISGTAKQSSLKSWQCMPQKCQKQAEAKRDGVINPQKKRF